MVLSRKTEQLGHTLLGGGEAESSANARLTRPNTLLTTGPAGWLPLAACYRCRPSSVLWHCPQLP